MKKIFKGLGLGFITLALILVGGVQVSADLTVAALAVTSSAAITVSSTTASAATFDSGTTGAVNIGTGASAKTVTVGNATTTTALALNSGTGDMTLTSVDDISILGGSAGSIINIGTNVDGNAINVGTDNTAADTIVIGSALDTSSLLGISVTVGSTGTTSALTLQSGTGDVTVTSTDDFIFTATDDITISGNSAAGILNLGTGNDGFAINVGTDNTAADTIIVGSALDNVDLAGEDIALTSADDIHILGGSAGSIINIGTNVDGNAINVGTDNTAADTIVIGSALDTSSLAGIAVTVGSTGTTSALTLQSGTGDVTVTSTDDFIFTATDDITISGNSAAGILNLGTGNDGFAINVGTDNTAADTIIVGSALDNVDLAGEDIALTSADDIHILGGSAGSIINIGTNVDGNAINVGTDNTAADTIIVGSALDNVDLAGEDIALTSADDIHILGGSAGSIINIGTNVDGNAINVGTDNTAADTIVIGSALDTSSLAGIAVTVGSTGTTSALTLQSGTGDVTVTSTDDFIWTATDDITISGNSAAGILNLGTGNDGYAINIGTDNTAADTIIVGSALDNVDLAGEDIALTSADDIHILGGSAGSIINIGTNVDGNAINVGTDNTAADTIIIGSA